MATNYIQPGNVIEHLAPSGGVLAGQGLKIGAREFGVALNTAVENGAVQLATEGVFTMAKTSALVISIGDLLYWDATNKVVNKTAAAQVCVGVAVSAAANPSATVQIKLAPVAVTPAGT
jgi:predicted RecA/RadA family phage recombinase